MINRLFSEPLTSSNSLALDLSATNKDLNPAIFGGIATFCAYIDKKLGDKIGVGGYLEHRIIYEAHENFATTSEDFRNIHLGIDFWIFPNYFIDSVRKLLSGITPNSG
jgi:hypothetical protein